MFKKSPDCRYCIGVFLCLVFTTTINAQPFLTQDQNPFSLIHGQPQPVAAELPEAGNSHWSLSLDIANTLNSESRSNEKLLLDFESHNLRFAWFFAFKDDWAIKVDIPFIHYGAGFLDNSIDSWHDFFGLPRAARPFVTDNQFRIVYERNGLPLIDLEQSKSSLGDIQIALAKSIFQKNDASLSLWLATDLPTGDQASLIGNHSSDVSLWLASDYKFSSDWRVDGNLGMLMPGKDQLASIPVENHVYFANAGIEWQAHSSFNLRIQLNGHSRFYSDSQLKLLGSAYSLVFGGRIHINSCSDLDLAASEDIQVGATPDVSFLFSWRSRTNCH